MNETLFGGLIGILILVFVAIWTLAMLAVPFLIWSMNNKLQDIGWYQKRTLETLILLEKYQRPPGTAPPSDTQE